MALTPEQIKSLIQKADGLAPKQGSIFVALVKLTEAEVRRQDEQLLVGVLSALEYHVAQTRPIQSTTTVISAIEERLSQFLP